MTSESLQEIVITSNKYVFFHLIFISIPGIWILMFSNYINSYIDGALNRLRLWFLWELNQIMIQWWESKFIQINIVGLNFEQLINSPVTYLPTVKEGCVTRCFNICELARLVFAIHSPNIIIILEKNKRKRGRQA